MIYEDILLRVLRAKVLESMSRSSRPLKCAKTKDQHSISALNKSEGRFVRPDDSRKPTEDFYNMYMYFARNVTKLMSFHHLPILQ